MWLMRCPECRAKFNTSKTSGRVRCPECDELFEPDWPDEPPPGPEDRPRRRRTRRKVPDHSWVIYAAILASILFCVLLFAAGFIWGFVNAEQEPNPFEPPEGGCEVLLPGNSTSAKSTFLNLQLTTHTGRYDGLTYVLASADIPAGKGITPQAGMNELVRQLGGSLKTSRNVNDPGYTGVEFEFSLAKKNHSASGRVIVAGDRYYHFYCTGRRAGLDNLLVRAFIDSFHLVEDRAWNLGPQPIQPPPNFNPPVRPAPNAGKGGYVPDPRSITISRGEVLGVELDPKRTDAGPPGSLLVGLEVGLAPFFDYNIVGTLRPIYRTGDRESLGEHYGSDERNGVVKLMAKPGYAIGAITAKTGLGIDGLSVTFMGIRGDELDPTDSYESEWVGGTGGGNPTRLTGNGTASDGLLIREGPERVSAVGLKFKSD